jgi:hypothetical protein
MHYIFGRQEILRGDDKEGDAEEDIMLEQVEQLDRDSFNISEMLNDSYADLDDLIQFLYELRAKPARTAEQQGVIDLVAKTHGQEWAERHAQLIIDQMESI